MEAECNKMSETEVREGLDLVKRGKAVVLARPDLMRKAGRWIDTEYSEDSVVSRRREFEAAMHARPPKPSPHSLPSVFQISGSKKSKDTRLWRLSAVMIDVCEFVDKRYDPWMSSRDPDRELHSAIGLIVGLLCQDATADQYLNGVTELATMKWADSERIAASRTFVDPYPKPKPFDRLRVLGTALECLEENATSNFSPRGTDLAAPAKPEEPRTGSPELTTLKALPKPCGWTRAELVNEAQIDGAKCGNSTFDKIRKLAKIPSAKRGGEGTQRRFSNAQLRKLINAVNQSSCRDRVKIASAWRQLLPKSESPESQLNPKL